MSLVSLYSQSIFLSDRSAAFGCLSFGCALSIGRRMDICLCETRECLVSWVMICRIEFSRALKGMKFWHALGVQLLSILIREGHRLDRPVAEPLQVHCNCADVLPLEDASPPSCRSVGDSSWTLVLGCSVSFLTGGVLTGVCWCRLARPSDGETFHGGSRRRGGGVLSEHRSWY